VLLVSLQAVLGISAFAQDYRARVAGAVMDASRSAIPGASVTLRNVNTGIEAVRETDALGNYRLISSSPEHIA
jgi:hypothetical protein